ncbi:hypothetical protein [Hyphomicrobium methylovorum]|uniref:hypothetical protein n=1 Tax=Hyphomicrobium methylovorum TaxID=84 RepID=UPI001FE2ECD1|nr:hypothetical protein [Hyphomicrobium methylovorum]
MSGFARAAEPAAAAPNCPAVKDERPLAPSKLAIAPPPLDEVDEYAALESVQYALTQVADGSSYVWHRAHGRLSGLVKPVSSFKDTHGSVCRHAVVVLSGTDVTKRTEIVACRLPTGIWQVSG